MFKVKRNGPVCSALESTKLTSPSIWTFETLKIWIFKDSKDSKGLELKYLSISFVLFFSVFFSVQTRCSTRTERSGRWFAFWSHSRQTVVTPGEIIVGRVYLRYNIKIYTNALPQFPNIHSRIYVTNYAPAFVWDTPVCSFACKIHCLLHLSQFYLIIASPPRIICYANVYYTVDYLRTTRYTVVAATRLRSFILRRDFIAMKSYLSINHSR